MERNGVVTKAFEAKDFFVSFLIFQKRKANEQSSMPKIPGYRLKWFCLQPILNHHVRWHW
jgi:hypothetical protein